MATENPLRLPPYKDTANFAPSTPKMVVEDMGFLWNDQRFYGSGREVGPNRSGSAPPNMEGSFLAINNLISHQKYGLNLGTNENFQVNESERQVRLDSYGSSIDIDRRFPTPPIPRENRHFGHRIGRYGSNWGSTSTYADNRSYLQPLTTHKEEFEDDLSTKHTSDNSVARTDGLWSGDDRAPLLGQSKSLVELIQEDFPRTPSPVYTHSHYLSSGATDEAADHDTDSTSCHDLSVSTDEAVVLSLDTDTTPLPVSANPEAGPVSSSLSINSTGISQSPSFSHQGNLRSAEVSIESQLKNLNISGLPITKEPKSKEQGQYNYQSSMPQQLMHQHQNNSFEVQNSKSQMHPRVSNSTYIGTDQFLHGPSKFSAEAQPVLQSSGFTSPVYPPVAGYMTSLSPYNANLQAAGLYSPQYGVGAYALNSNVAPPFVAGYPPHGAIPVIFDGQNDPNLNARMPVASGRGNGGHGFDMQHFNKFYGQLGYAMQPSFMDPVYMQYYQQSYGLPYNVSGQLDPMASGTGVIGGQNYFADSKKESGVPVGFNDLKLQYQRSEVSNMNQSRVGMMNPPYFGNSLNVGILIDPSSSLASSALPGSPMASNNASGGRAEVRFSPSAGRYGAVYSGWSSERGSESFNNPKIYNFLEELKSGKGRRFELADIAGHIVEFSSDQHGSRFIQQKLETCSAEEKSSVFGEVLPCASKLMTDVFGNYVIQKFFEYGSPEQRKELASQLSGQILPLSLQMYGCRVIQKALEVIDLDQKAHLVSELDGHVTRCVHDQNGNHVIQKCIESIPTEKIQFIISAFRGDVAMLSMHPYGCRVIQRVLEHCTDELQCQFIVDEILESVCVLAKDQYGNYVTQHVLVTGKSHERRQIISKLSGHVVQLSQHKFASNVVEKCLVYGTATDRELIIGEILGQDEGNDNLLTMMKDQFANYVVQMILDICTDTQRARLFNRMKIHVHALKKYTYGKHIVARFEQHFGEDNQAS